MCSYCGKQFMPGVMGMDKQLVTFSQDTEESFVLHEHCYEEILEHAVKIKDEEKRQKFYRTILNKLSE